MGTRKSGLTDGQLVLMGKGMIAKIKQDPSTRPWIGGSGKQPVDPVQSELNHKLGYW